jgi:hypothetical protein
MEQDPGCIKIQICRTGQSREGMGHILESKDHIWDGFYHFDLFKATIRKKRVDIPNYVKCFTVTNLIGRQLKTFRPA